MHPVYRAGLIRTVARSGTVFTVSLPRGESTNSTLFSIRTPVDRFSPSNAMIRVKKTARGFRNVAPF